MKQFLCYLALALGVCFGGRQIYKGIHEIAAKDRYVSVRGLSERTVTADKVTWPLSFNVVGNDMMALYNDLDTKQKSIIAFLKSNGVGDDEIFLSAASVNDRLANQWGNQDVRFRYQTSATITVISRDVERVRGIMLKQSDLIRQGVAVEGNDYATRYEYTSLNDLKPEMVEEATRNARAVAQKFAADAECELGSIKQASQGYFSVENADENTPHLKKVRVVTTVEYFLD